VGHKLEAGQDPNPNPSKFLRGGSNLVLPSPTILDDDTIRVVVSLEDQAGQPVFVIAFMDFDLRLLWRSPPYSRQPTIILQNKDYLVYRFSSREGAPRPGFADYFSVRFREGLTTLPEQFAEQYRVIPTFSFEQRGNAFFARTSSAALEEGERFIYQKWAVPEAAPTLAPSTFGLEDGNLIISWPTAAGQTYQVQRSTDLESWENIGVALTGNGTTMSYAQPSNADKVFLRVVIP
jgi:hypothetical protein